MTTIRANRPISSSRQSRRGLAAQWPWRSTTDAQSVRRTRAWSSGRRRYELLHRCRDSRPSSGGFGKARSHSSAASTCRLNEIQNAGPKLHAKSNPAIWKSASQIRTVPIPMPIANARIINDGDARCRRYGWPGQQAPGTSGTTIQTPPAEVSPSPYGRTGCPAIPLSESPQGAIAIRPTPADPHVQEPLK